MAKLALLTLHGMGETSPSYWDELYDNLRDEVSSNVWQDIHFEPVFYQDVLQGNQLMVWAKMPAEHMDWAYLRKFLLFGFSDAATLETRPDRKTSEYVKVQLKIRESLSRCFDAVDQPNRPVVIVAQSLGCQVISNYIWDAERAYDVNNPKDQYVWKHHKLPNAGPDTDEGKFLRLRTLRYLFTTGCNIPIFVAGRPKIEAISRPNDAFQWLNYFDADDVLGWPMRPLSDSYEAVVNRDIAIDAGGFFEKRTPLSHNAYWRDNDFIEPVARHISNLHGSL